MTRRDPQTIYEEYLVLASQGGNDAALAELVRRWQPRLLRHAGRLVANADHARDAVQDAWLAIAKGLRRLADPARFPAWALRIVSHKCADRIRRDSLRRESEERVGLATESAPSDETARLRDALLRLPDGERTLLSLLYVDGLTVTEIADVLGIPNGTVKSRLYRARTALREALERTTP